MGMMKHEYHETICANSAEALAEIERQESLDILYDQWQPNHKQKNLSEEINENQRNQN